MPTRLLSLLSILTIALLLAAAEPARADGGHADSSKTTLDSYTITLTTPQGDAQTGKNLVEVALHDGHQQPLAGATVTASLLAYASGEGGHGDSHGEAAPADSPADAAAADTHGQEATDTHADAAASDTHGQEAAASDTHGQEATGTHADAAAADTHGHEATDSPAEAAASDIHGHEATDSPADAAASDTHGHEAADTHAEAAAVDHGTDGQGLVPAPVALAATDKPGVYRGELSFEQPGTYTVGVVVTAGGQELGTTFELAVAQSRPRGLVLGGFALVNALAIGSAAFLKRRTPAKPTRPAKPAPAAATTPEEQP